jgi:hypothetical protein
MRTFTPPQVRKLHLLRPYKMRLQREKLTSVRRQYQSVSPCLRQLYKRVKGICTKEPRKEVV